ncbi:MAG: hypothetical protein AB8B55_22725 [Mariniblastus sp.]
MNSTGLLMHSNDAEAMEDYRDEDFEPSAPSQNRSTPQGMWMDGDSVAEIVNELSQCKEVSGLLD